MLLVGEEDFVLFFFLLSFCTNHLGGFFSSLLALQQKFSAVAVVFSFANFYLAFRARQKLLRVLQHPFSLPPFLILWHTACQEKSAYVVLLLCFLM